MTSVPTISGVIPRYVYDYSDALNVTTRQTVAFQATCKCGWTGSWRALRSAAMDDYQLHKRNVHE